MLRVQYTHCIHCDKKINNFHKKYFIEEIVDFDNRRIEERFVCVKCLNKYTVEGGVK